MMSLNSSDAPNAQSFLRRARLPMWPDRSLSLAAAPIFATMAWVASNQSGGTPAFCSAAAETPPLNGMVAMYVLMSIVHFVPWLKLIRGAPS